MSKLSKQIIVSTSTHGLLTLKYSSKYPTTHAPPSISLGKLFRMKILSSNLLASEYDLYQKLRVLIKSTNFYAFFFMRVVTSAYLSQFTKV